MSRGTSWVHASGRWGPYRQASPPPAQSVGRILSPSYSAPPRRSVLRAAAFGVNGSAEHYVAKTGTPTLVPGDTTKATTIEVKGDSKKESNETFFMDLFGLSGNAPFTKSRGIGTILNDD